MIPVVYGRNRAGLFAPRFQSRNFLVARHCTRDKPALSQSPVFPESLIVAIIDSSLFRPRI
jgi:hypothetical protein